MKSRTILGMLAVAATLAMDGCYGGDAGVVYGASEASVTDDPTGPSNPSGSTPSTPAGETGETSGGASSKPAGCAGKAGKAGDAELAITSSGLARDAAIHSPRCRAPLFSASSLTRREKRR